MTRSRVAGRAPAPDHVEELRRRAAEIAHVPVRERTGEVQSFVIFRLADERYAIDARIVLQVHVLRELTPLAGARAPLFGITHWRGLVLTILDLRELLGVRTRGVTDLSRVIVIDGGRQPFGILADSASDFVDLPESLIRPLPTEDASARALLRGMTDDAVRVLDMEAVLRTGRGAAQDGDTTVRGG